MRVFVTRAPYQSLPVRSQADRSARSTRTARSHASSIRHSRNAHVRRHQVGRHQRREPAAPERHPPQDGGRQRQPGQVAVVPHHVDHLRVLERGARAGGPRPAGRG